MTSAYLSTTTGTLVLNTEVFIDIADAGSYVLRLDTTPLTATENVELRAYSKAQSGGSSTTMWRTTIYGARMTDNKVLDSWPLHVPFSVSQAARFSVKLIAGTGRDLPYTVIRLNDDDYLARIWLADDNSAGTPTDRYSVRWYKNGIMIRSGITNAKIQVIKDSDGSDLIALTSMTQVATTGRYKFEETTNRISDGASYEVYVEATIDGSTRTFSQPMSRDS